MKSFEDWLDENYDDLNCKITENGLDLEYDFDYELFWESEYEQYLSTVAL